MSQPLNILLVEDDDVSTEAVIRSLRKFGFSDPVVTAEDGQVALDVLRAKHPERTIDKPYVILLDLNMPRMNGFEFLQEVRADPALKESVIFVLTTSSADSDKLRAYQENVAGYMVKTSVGPQFSKLAMLLQDYAAAVDLP